MHFVKNICILLSISNKFHFLKTWYTGNEAFERLMKKGYIVRSGAAFGIDDGIRNTVGLKEENDEIIELLKAL